MNPAERFAVVYDAHRAGAASDAELVRAQEDYVLSLPDATEHIRRSYLAAAEALTQRSTTTMFGGELGATVAAGEVSEADLDAFVASLNLGGRARQPR